jgi:hypothetical protein
MRGGRLHRVRRTATPYSGLPGLLDASESREPTSTGQQPSLGIRRDDGDLQLAPLGLAPQKVEIQGTGEKAHVPGDDKRDATTVQPTEPMLDGGEVILGLQFQDSERGL